MSSHARIAVAAGLVLVILAGTAAASHASLTLPLYADADRVQTALHWLATPQPDGETPYRFVNEEGCVVREDWDGSDRSGCLASPTKKWTYTVARTGADPLRWPEPDRSVGDWLLANADDLCTSSGCEPDGSATERTMSLVKSILAVRSMGINPREVPLPGDADATRDLVSDLLEMHQNGQFGYEEYVNDDIWAVIALNSADHTDSKVHDAIDWIRRHQDPTGGVGWSADDLPRTSSPDMTASAIMALAPHGEEAFVDDGVGYLRDTQTQEGLYRGCWAGPSGEGGSSHSTSRAILGLIAADRDPVDWSVDGQTPVECLAKLQNDDGGFEPSSKDTNAADEAATQQALTGLTWIPFDRFQPEIRPISEAGDRPSWPGIPGLDRERTVRVGETAILSNPDVTYRLGDESVDEVERRPDRPGTLSIHGYDRNRGRKVNATLSVLPPRPDPPTLSTPSAVPHGEPFNVSLRPADPWTRTLVLVTPSGSVRPGRNHTLTIDEPGRHRLQAFGINGIGEAGSSKDATVHVTNAPPTVEAVDAPEVADRVDQTNLTAQVGDPEGDDVEVRWTLPDGEVLSGPAVRHRFSIPGNRNVHLVAADEHGARSARNVSIRVTNEAPTGLRLNVPQTALRTDPVTVQAQAGDPEDDPIRYRWSVGGDPAGNGSSIALAPGPPGNVTVGVVAEDRWGATSQATVNLTWVDTPPRLLVDGPSTARPGSIPFRATAEDPDGDPVEVRWSVDGEVRAEGRNVTLSLSEGNHSVVAEAASPYASVQVQHRVRVEAGLLQVNLSWEGDRLVVNGTVERLSAANVTGPPPLRLDEVEPGDRLTIEGLEDGRVVRRATVSVPQPPQPIQAPEGGPDSEHEEPGNGSGMTETEQDPDPTGSGPSSLAVNITWTRDGTLRVDADASRIAVHNQTGSPPIRIGSVRPGDRLVVEAIDASRVVDRTVTVVPERPPNLVDDADDPVDGTAHRADEESSPADADAGATAPRLPTVPFAGIAVAFIAAWGWRRWT